MQAKRTTRDESAHFILQEDLVGGKALRYVLRCKKCNKDKTFGPAVKQIKHKCCNREYEKDLGEKAPEKKD